MNEHHKRHSSHRKVKQAHTHMIAFCMKNGYDPELIVSRRRCARTTEKRKKVAKHLRSIGFSLPVIGVVMDRNHSTILYHVCEEAQLRKKHQMIKYMKEMTNDCMRCDFQCECETSLIEKERRNRILVCAAAFAYEYEDDPVMSDSEFDALCLQIRPWISTGNSELDTFFREEFHACTGSWVHNHPDKEGLQRVLEILRKGNPNERQS